MYNEYFGFKETPFSIAPDPRYLYMSERHREALAHLLYGIQSDGGFVLITGEVGTGKTTTCRCLLEQIPENTEVAFVLNPKLTAAELLATICDELGIPYPEGNTSIKLFVDRINARLIEAHGKGRRTVLIIDEAQNLGTEVLEQIRLLTNLETNRRKLLQIVMLGQPELLEMLSRPELRQLAQRITARYHLDPLSPVETGAYVSHRLAVAGMVKKLFPDSVLARIFHLTGGIPRLINIVCDRALLGAYAQGRAAVDQETLKRAAREIFGEAGGRGGTKKNSGRRMMAAVALAGVGVVLGAVLYLNWPGSMPIIAVASLPESTNPSPKMPPAPVMEHLPAIIFQDRSGEEAFKALFREWGISYQPAENQAPCQFAQARGLLCLSEKGSLRTLHHLNRPAVLKLVDDQGQEFFALLTALQDNSATVRRGDDKWMVSVDELEDRWFGEFTLFWRPPPEYQGDLQPGDLGPQVSWLDQQLAGIEGRTPDPSEGRLHFDDSLAARVKKFQIRAGLVPDGIVGVKTLIKINTAAGGNIPLLTDPVEGN